MVVGSVNKFNNWSKEYNLEESQKILDRCADQLYPGLRHAEIVDQWVGLRPFRLGGVRLEHELFKQNMNVVHNYGHGGCGVTLSWGCAGEVVQEVQKLLEQCKLNRL